MRTTDKTDAQQANAPPERTKTDAQQANAPPNRNRITNGGQAPANTPRTPGAGLLGGARAGVRATHSQIKPGVRGASPVDEPAVAAPPKVGIEPPGLALAVTTGACLAAGDSLLMDHDVRRIKKALQEAALLSTREPQSTFEHRNTRPKEYHTIPSNRRGARSSQASFASIVSVVAQRACAVGSGMATLRRRTESMSTSGLTQEPETKLTA